MIEYNFASELNKKIHNKNDTNEIIDRFLTDILEKNNSLYLLNSLITLIGLMLPNLC